MHKAFKSVRKNRGAAGIDRQSIAMFEANLEQNLAALMKDLKGGNFVPKPARRTYIDKGGGKQRPLGIPTVAAYCTSCNKLWGSWAKKSAGVNPIRFTHPLFQFSLFLGIDRDPVR